MDQLTRLERELLRAFESLAQECAASGRLSSDTAARLLDISGRLSSEIESVRRRQDALEQRLQGLTQSLSAQTRLTESLSASLKTLASALKP